VQEGPEGPEEAVGLMLVPVVEIAGGEALKVLSPDHLVNSLMTRWC